MIKRRETGRDTGRKNVFRITKWHSVAKYLGITPDLSLDCPAVAGLVIRVNQRVIIVPPAIRCGSADGVLRD